VLLLPFLDAVRSSLLLLPPFDHWKGGRAFNPLFGFVFVLDTFLREGELTDNDTFRTLTLAPPAILQNIPILHTQYTEVQKILLFKSFDVTKQILTIFVAYRTMFTAQLMKIIFI
jgi:hypothetical protein